MLPTTWHTDRLRVEDVAPGDLDTVQRCLADAGDAAPLDPAFAMVPRAELETLIARSVDGAALAARPFQMQMLRLRDAGETVGYWHVMAVPNRPGAVGVSIMLMRPPHRRQGLGREMVAAALTRFDGAVREVWARVYLANPRAIEFWADLGFVTLVRHAASFVSPPAGQPSIILARPLRREA